MDSKQQIIAAYRQHNRLDKAFKEKLRVFRLNTPINKANDEKMRIYRKLVALDPTMPRPTLTPNHKVPADVQRILDIENKAHQKLEARTSGDWLGLILKLPEGIRDSIAKIVWWDWFGENTVSEGDGDFNDYLLKDGDCTNEVIVVRLLQIGYTPYKAIARVKGKLPADCTV